MPGASFSDTADPTTCIPGAIQRQCSQEDPDPDPRPSPQQLGWQGCQLTHGHSMSRVSWMPGVALFQNFDVVSVAKAPSFQVCWRPGLHMCLASAGKGTAQCWCGCYPEAHSALTENTGVKGKTKASPLLPGEKGLDLHPGLRSQ